MFHRAFRLVAITAGSVVVALIGAAGASSSSSAPREEKSIMYTRVVDLSHRISPRSRYGRVTPMSYSRLWPRGRRTATTCASSPSANTARLT
jgi:hypothetical protein